MKRLKCPECGLDYTGGEKYCSECGTEIKPAGNNETESEDQDTGSDTSDSSSTAGDSDSGRDATLILGGLVAVSLFLVFGLPRLPILATAAGIDNPALQPLEVGAPSNTDIQYDSDRGLYVGLTIPVRNPNHIRAELDEIEYDLYVEDELLGSGSTRSSYSIPANGQKDLQATLDVTLGSSVEAGASYLWRVLQSEEVPYRFQGNLIFDAGPKNFEIPFERRGAY